MTTVDIDPTERVRERYATVAQRVAAGDTDCCGDTCCGSGNCACFGDSDPISANLYSESETASLPVEAVVASLGCGNPTALITLHEGETVLDLGSGGGIDVLLSARRVGPTGFAFGVDMTDEMLALALQNKEKSGLHNVAFLKGQIDQVPLPAQSVDVVISNCVINLAADKAAVLRDAFRVLRPGGRFAVADVVCDGPVPDALRHNMESWVGCIAGALDADEYRALLHAAGFEGIEIEITRRYTAEEAGLDLAQLPADWQEADGRLASAFVRATRPPATEQDPAHLTVAATAGGCGSDCCRG